MGFAPVVDGNQLSDAEFSALDEHVQAHFLSAIDSLEDALIESLIELPRWKRESSEKLRNLKTTIEMATKPLKALNISMPRTLGCCVT